METKPAVLPLLRARLLGTPELTLDGRPLAGPIYAKLQALLAYLLMEGGRRHRREALAELFWPEQDSAAARRNLRVGLHHLRRALGPVADRLLLIDRRFVGLAPAPPAVVDAPEFAAPAEPGASLSALERRAGLYRGDFLAGLELPAEGGLADWVEAWRSDLRGRMTQLLARLIADNVREGRLQTALRHAERRCGLIPWDEAALREWLELLARAGRAAEVRERFQAFEARLSRDWDLAPEAATQALAERIQSAAAEAPTDQPHSELRRVTVLSLRVQHSAALADPEAALGALRTVEEGLQRWAELAQVRLRATGDGGWVAVFGSLRSREGEARQALALALRAVSAVWDEAPGLRLGGGVHSGLVLSGSDRAPLPEDGGLVAGCAAVLAAGAAGEVRISAETAGLVRRFFELDPLDEPAPGPCGELLVYRVLRPSGAQDRLSDAPLTPFCGRLGEQRRLREQWQQALGGAAGWVLIEGEPGLGKSRLAGLLCAEAAAEPGCVVRILRCREELRGGPYAPLIELAEGLLKQEAREGGVVALARLLARQGVTAPEALPALARLLGLGQLAAGRRWSAEQFKAHAEDALLGLLGGAGQATLLLCEDVHWMDTSSRELLQRLFAAPPGRLLILCTARPGGWRPAPCTRLELAPLDGVAVEGMVRGLVGAFADELAAPVQRLADGVPLFVEELTRTLLQQRAAGEPAGTLPASLSELLQARLDGLAALKPLVQAAALLGRRFPLDWFAALQGVPTVAAVSQLQPLADAGILIRQADDETPGYLFKHALLQQAAYESLPQARRTPLHAQAAETLCQLFPERAALRPECAAHHFAGAGRPLDAAQWGLRAARRALQACAAENATEQLQAGLEALAQLPVGTERDDLELEYRLLLGHALHARQGFGSAAAAAAYDRAAELLQGRADDRRRFEALWGLWVVSSSRPGGGYALSEQLVQELAEAAGEQAVHQAYTRSAAANIALWRGRFAEACAQAELAPEVAVAPSTLLHGYHPRIAALSHLAWAQLHQGRPGEAVAASAAAVASAEGVEHVDSLCFALAHAATLRRWLRDPPTLQRLTERLLQLSTSYQLALWQAAGSMLHGWVLVFEGDAGGLDLLEAAAAGARESMPGALGAFLTPLAEALGQLEQTERQLAVIEEGLQTAAKLDEGLHRGELLLLQAEALLRRDEPAAAEVALAAAREYALEHEGGFIGLRAAVTLGGLRARQGRHREARERLHEALPAWVRHEEPIWIQDEADALLRLVEQSA